MSAGIYPLDLWMRVIEEAPVDCILTHNHYSLIDTRGIELLPKCKEKNIGVINASPFASSLMSRLRSWHPYRQAGLPVRDPEQGFSHDHVQHGPGEFGEAQL